MLSLITVTLSAQVGSSANVSATIVSEVGITELQGSNLITFASSKNELNVGSTAGISMLTNIKTVEIFSFKVISNENDFSVTLPQTSYRFVKKDDASTYITAELFVMSPLNKNNNQPISITSVFKMDNFQTPGNYYLSPVEITVNYN